MKLIPLTLLFLATSIANAQYCVSGGPTSDNDSNLGNILLNGETTSINISTNCPGFIGVQDLTSSQSADLIANISYSLSIDFNTCSGNFTNSGQIWIDYNMNNIFESNESIGTYNGGVPSGAQNYNFLVPSWVCNGPTRIRFMQEEGGGLPLNPCATFSWGSVIDAEIILSGGSCQIAGCMDSLAFNYNPNATFNDGSCLYPTEQDCAGAIPLCAGTTYRSPNNASYMGIGNITNEFSTSNTCFGTGSGMPTGEPEVNSVWYTFTVPNSGDLNFTITPDDLSVDYDWAVFDITGPDRSCQTLHEDGAVSCNWSGTPGPTGPNGQPGGQNEPPFPVEAGHTYAVVVTDYAASGVPMTIDFGESTANIYVTDMNTDNQEICYGDSADLRALYSGPSFGTLDYSWSPTDLVVDSTKQNTTSIAIFQDTTIFYVSLNLGACNFEDSIIVRAYEAYSEFTISYDSIYNPVIVEFENTSAENTISYFWDFDNGMIFEKRNPTEQQYFEPGEYNVMLVIENELGCVDTAYQRIVVPEYYVPNIITPNGDGVNDFFIITGLKELTNFYVYNRWGKKVLEILDYQNNFDGGDLVDGRYFYRLAKQDGSIIEGFEGWFDIKR